MQRMKSGFTLVELLVVIGILGVLIGIVVVAIHRVRIDAQNTRVVSNVRQLRALAESAYDSNGATYVDWTQFSGVQAKVIELLEDTDAAYGDAAGAPYVTDTIQTEEKEFCISAPLHPSTGGYFCVDTSGVYKTTTAECPTETPLTCP